jgi:two-component system, NarL family, nitrate/nitrite response regulator NarL
MIRLLIVDDHIPSRETAGQTLAADNVIGVVGVAETSDEALKKAQQLLPDIVLLDLHLPGLIQTPDLIKRLNTLKNVKVIMYASQAKAAEAQDLLDAGAAAYVLKTDPPALVRMAMVMVQRGSRNIISPALPRNITRLTAAERNILTHITRRGGLARAAERMGISEVDLTPMLEHLCEKLEVKSPEHLLRWAKKQGY